MKKVTLVIAEQNLGSLINAVGGMASKISISDYFPDALEQTYRKPVASPIKATNGHYVAVDVEAPTKKPHANRGRKLKSPAYPRIDKQTAKAIYMKHASKGPYLYKDLEVWAKIEGINPSALVTCHGRLMAGGKIHSEDIKGTGHHLAPKIYTLMEKPRATPTQLAQLSDKYRVRK